MSRTATQSARGKTPCAVGMYEEEKEGDEFGDRGDRTTGGPERDEFGGTVDEGPSRRTNCGSWEMCLGSEGIHLIRRCHLDLTSVNCGIFFACIDISRCVT